jgi:hypothetical protein
LWARAKTDLWRRCAGRFCTLLIIPKPVRRILYPLALTALSTPCRTITTNSLIPVTTPPTTAVLGDVAVPPSTIPKGQSIIRPVQ